MGLLHRSWLEPHVAQRRSEATGPSHLFLGQKSQQEAKVLIEARPQLAFIGDAKRNLRRDFDAASDRQLGAPIGDRIERDEIFRHAHGIQARQQRDARSQPNLLSLGGNRPEQDEWRRQDIVPEVVFADPYTFEPSLLGAHRRLDDQLEALGLSDVLTRRRVRQMISKA